MASPHPTGPAPGKRALQPKACSRWGARQSPAVPSHRSKNPPVPGGASWSCWVLMEKEQGVPCGRGWAGSGWRGGLGARHLPAGAVLVLGAVAQASLAAAWWHWLWWGVLVAAASCPWVQRGDQQQHASLRYSTCTATAQRPSPQRGVPSCSTGSRLQHAVPGHHVAPVAIAWCPWLPHGVPDHLMVPVAFAWCMWPSHSVTAAAQCPWPPLGALGCCLVPLATA